MGIRIHRSLGWAATHPDKDGLMDRLLERGEKGEVAAFVGRRLCQARENGEDGLRTSLFLELPPRLPEYGENYPSLFAEVVKLVTGPDYDGSTWVMAPPSFALRWHRTDDALDYYSVRHRADWERRNVMKLDWNPSPYGDTTAEAPASVRALASELGFPDLPMPPVLATWWC